MHWTREDIKNKERIERLNLVNSLTGIKPANLIGSISKFGTPNLAIFSSVVHLGSDPALLGFIVRPGSTVRRHTYDNILETGFYTINHVTESMAEQAHYTSAKFQEHESEFDTCQLGEEYLFRFPAPFVWESPLKIGMKFEEEISIALNGTKLIVGSIEHIVVPEEAVLPGLHLDLGKYNAAGISGLNSYYRLDKLDQFPYARTQELPDFSDSEQR